MIEPTYLRACLEKSFGSREPEQIISVCNTLICTISQFDTNVYKMVIYTFYMIQIADLEN